MKLAQAAPGPLANPLRILFVHSWDMWGGGEIHTTRFVRMLRARGHTIGIAQMGHERFRGQTDVATLFSFPERRASSVYLLRLFRKFRPDVVIEIRGGGLEYGAALDVACILSQTLAIPIEHSPAPVPLSASELRKQSLARKTYRMIRHGVRRAVHTTAVTHRLAVSQHVAETVSNHMNLKMSSICVVNNGIDLSHFVYSASARAILRKSLALSDTHWAIGVVGRLSKEKNVAGALSSFHLLDQSKPGAASLFIVGDGPERRNLEERANELGLRERVTFLGHRTDTAALYSALDCVLTATYSEGLSLGLLEATACGLPIVCAPYPGLDTIASVLPNVFCSPTRAAHDLAATMMDALVAAGVSNHPARSQIARTVLDKEFDETKQLTRLCVAVESLTRQRL